jgi:hypothetical protein
MSTKKEKKSIDPQKKRANLLTFLGTPMKEQTESFFRFSTASWWYDARTTEHDWSGRCDTAANRDAATGADSFPLMP